MRLLLARAKVSGFGRGVQGVLLLPPWWDSDCWPDSRVSRVSFGSCGLQVSKQAREAWQAVAKFSLKGAGSPGLRHVFGSD